MTGDFTWLVARPIAHRGLHDAAKGIVENSLAAARAAVAGRFAIECDARLGAHRFLLQVFALGWLTAIMILGPRGTRTASVVADDRS